MTGVGLTQEDMLCVAKEFKQIYGLPSYCGGLGDPDCGRAPCAPYSSGESSDADMGGAVG